ncbi:putative heme-binding protein [Thermochaetoides thermophila DSM 1495]|uniref:Putative heme-binding protein n=1 Tax=Chaetomium thermophilum (strain DSM 1495 / CBS 144.50 / IMI 039719) TaxID=759272 RepID=G0SAV0_CHATD|nr:putative heme-binding protein [Thermochaetoides thermophila DSM 1495]EGS19330.1 putative heme-binding protein [Thermochaetoides thermophila DSM 1495]
MALLGLSLILASVIWVAMRKPGWLPAFFAGLLQGQPPSPQLRELSSPPSPSREAREGSQEKCAAAAIVDEARDTAHVSRRRDAAQQNAHHHPQLRVITPDATDRDGRPSSSSTDDDGQSTPKAGPVRLGDGSLNSMPTFVLSTPDESSRPGISPSPSGRSPSSQPTPSTSTSSLSTTSPSPSTLMPPPPRPRPSIPRPTLPLPNRAPPPQPSRQPGCSTLAPPPTVPSASLSPQSSKTKSSSRAVTLQPGHSPLDWARLTSSAAAQSGLLRGLPPGTPYIRVTPSMLKQKTGRKGKDAWTVLGGRVYNITPYLPFHPGGEPELLRCAGRDGTRLFNEVHPWVNWEGMLAACLVGIYVTEEEEGNVVGGGIEGGNPNPMEEMD